jgi:hypothetical protein
MVLIFMTVLPIAGSCMGGSRDKKMKCDKLHFVKEGEDTCWIDTSMYIMIVPKESFKIIKPVMYEVPELFSYVKILRRNQKAFINRCSPGGGNEVVLMKKMIKTMGLSYLQIDNWDKNHKKITDISPDYIFYSNEIPKNGKIPDVPDTIHKHKLIGMIFHVEYKNRPSLGHVACAVLCDSKNWRYYNNCSHKIHNLKEKNHNDVAERVSYMITMCKASGGPGSRVDEIMCIYCKVF